jgi:hypothetical protein
MVFLPSGQNEAIDEKFRKHLETIFGAATAHNVEFENPYTNSISVNSVYVAKKKETLSYTGQLKI